MTAINEASAAWLRTPPAGDQGPEFQPAFQKWQAPGARYDYLAAGGRLDPEWCLARIDGGDHMPEADWDDWDNLLRRTAAPESRTRMCRYTGYLFMRKRRIPQLLAAFGEHAHLLDLRLLPTRRTP